MRWLIAGDWHGNLLHAQRQLDIARERGCERLLQLGDLAVYWPRQNEYMSKLQRHARQVDVPIWFLDGNHENFDALYALPVADDGLRYLGDYLQHMPRGFTFDAAGTRFAAVGGAYSIDKRHRLLAEARGDVKSWWEQEQLTDDDVQTVLQAGTVDVLLTHDCAPNYVALQGMRSIEESARHQLLLSDCARSLQPSLWMHGHMHSYMRYRWPEYGDWSSQVVSLDCDGTKKSSVVLEFEHGTTRIEETW